MLKYNKCSYVNFLNRLGKPSLVRETSRMSGFVGFLKSIFTPPAGQEQLADVVVHSTLETRIYDIAKSTKNAVFDPSLPVDDYTLCLIY